MSAMSYPEQKQFELYASWKLINYQGMDFTVDEFIEYWKSNIAFMSKDESDRLAKVIHDAKRIVRQKFPLHNGESSLFGKQ